MCFKAGDVSQVLRTTRSAFVSQEVFTSDHWHCQTIDFDGESIRPRFVEHNALDRRDYIYATRGHAELQDLVAQLEVSDAEVIGRSTEAQQRTEHSLRVFRGRTNPQIDIACRSRQTVCCKRVRADQQIFNVLGVEVRQRVAKVGVEACHCR